MEENSQREDVDLDMDLQAGADKQTEKTPEEVPMRLRDNLYSKINLSVRTMDLVIGVLAVALIVFIAYGIWQANIR